MIEASDLEQVAAAIPEPAGNTVSVAVDGLAGAGKSTFCASLASALRAHGRTAVQASADGFHNPREVRYRRGRMSPEGFWLDSYDYRRFIDEVLIPFDQGEGASFRTAIYDKSAEQQLDVEPQPVPPSSTLLVDGLFLLRDELIDHWDFTVFLDVEPEVALDRLSLREGRSADSVLDLNRRIIDGQALYFAACEPRSRASLVINNSEPARSL